MNRVAFSSFALSAQWVDMSPVLISHVPLALSFESRLQFILSQALPMNFTPWHQQIVECEQNKCPTYIKVLCNILVNTAGKNCFCLAAQRLSRQKSEIRNLTISRRSPSVWKQFKTEVFEYQRASIHPGSCSLLYSELIYYCIQSTDYKPGTCGVPQGSDRDPLFFW